MRSTAWLWGAVLLAAIGVGAAAQDESAAIKQGLEASLQKYAKLGDATLYSYGGIDVAAEGQGHKVVVTDVRVAPEETGYLAVGDVSFRLVPEGADFYRVSDLAMAETIPYRNSDGSAGGALNLPSQQFSGRWSRSLGILVDADFAYRNIGASDEAGQPVLSVGDVASTTTSTDSGNGRWDTQTSFRVGDVHVSGDGETMTVAKIDGSGNGRGVDMALAAGLFPRLWTLAAGVADDVPPPEFFQAMTDVYRMYGAFDATYRVDDVRVRDASGSETFSLPELTADVRGDGFDRDAGNLDMVFRLNGLRAVDAGIVAIGGLDIRSTTKGFKVSEYLKLLERMQRLAANPDQPPDPDSVQAMIAMLSIAAGGNFEAAVRDVSYSDPDGTELFRLADAAVAAHGEGFDQDMARAGLALRHSGLAATIDDPTVRDFVPLESKIGISLENLPVREIASQASAAFSQSATLPAEQQDMAAMMFFGAAQQALAQARTQVKLTDWHLRSAAAAIDLDGVIEGSMESMMGAVASAQLDISGLDRIIETVRALSTPEDQDVIAGFEVLRGFSNRQTAADGAVVDRYDIRFTPEGQFLINNKEFSFMGPPDGGTTPDSPPPASGESATGN